MLKTGGGGGSNPVRTSQCAASTYALKFHFFRKKKKLSYIIGIECITNLIIFQEKYSEDQLFEYFLHLCDVIHHYELEQVNIDFNI